MRTTLNLDDDVLQQLRRRQRREGKPLGQLVSELLARALDDDEPPPEQFQWVTAPLHARVDLEDREAVQAILDQR